MSVAGTLGPLLQGVNQQPPSVRPDGTLTEQVNMLSDVVLGLTARPSLRETAAIINFPVSDYTYTDVEIGDRQFFLGYKAGEMSMWDKNGVEQTIVFQNTGGVDPRGYIGEDMRAYVFDDKMFLVNRDVVVDKAASPDTSSAFVGAGIAYCLGGQFSRTYRLQLRYSDGTTCYSRYDTPDGTTAGDAELTSAERIAKELADDLRLANQLRPETVIVDDGSAIGITDDTNEFTLSVSDGESGLTLRAFTDRITDIDDLSETAFHGMIVRVTNSDEGTNDDFYMRFNSDISNTLGDGFGDGGVWEEWHNVNVVSDFDLSTMPHILVQTDTTEFTFRQGSWASRKTGDAQTNPFPDFLGRAIRDISGFQSRLVVVAGDVCSMSRTNKPLNFFKDSATTDLATDPINIASTEASETSLDWIIPFDRDLLLMADPGNGQFIISGADKLTSDNASIVKTTSFELQGRAKPVTTGRTVLFPFKSGKFSGLKEFFTNDAIATNGADNLTEAADRYIQGRIDKLKCSTNFNIALCWTNSTVYPNSLWVYKYLWSNTEKLQSSWSRWELPHPVKHYFFNGSEIVVLMQADGANGTDVDLVFGYMDLDLSPDNVTDFHICLDRQVTATATANSKIRVPYANAVFIQGPGCENPGMYVNPEAESARDASSGNVTYDFDPDIVPEGASVICGVAYDRYGKPTMPLYRGRDGRPQPRTSIVVSSFTLHYNNAGYIKTIMDAKYRSEPWEYEVDFFPLDDDFDDVDANGVHSGMLCLPWGERSDWSELTIFSNDARPLTIVQVDWAGQIYRGRRE